MKDSIQPIATVTSTSGLDGDVRLRPLSRYFEDYIGDGTLMLGTTSSQSKLIQLELITGVGKKRRFKFQGVDTLNDAERIVGKTLFVEASPDDNINMISKNIFIALLISFIFIILFKISFKVTIFPISFVI